MDPPPWSSERGGERDELPSFEGRVGDPTVTPDEVRSMGNLVATRHLLALLARRPRQTGRDAAIDEVVDLLLGLNDGPYARRLLLEAAEGGRIADIYPLEVMVRMMERSATAVPRTAFGEVVSNIADVEGRAWPVGEVIPLKVPLNLRMKAFALEGGGTPGYVLAPGPLATYWLEFGAPGAYRLLFRGEVRKESRVQRVAVRIEDPPESGR